MSILQNRHNIYKNTVYFLIREQEVHNENDITNIYATYVHSISKQILLVNKIWSNLWF